MGAFAELNIRTLRSPQGQVTGPGWVGWLEFLPAAFEQELKLSFNMGVDAPGDTWKKGVYDGVVDQQGMAKLKIR